MKGRIEVVCWMDKNGQLKISIEDTGIGISEEYQKKLFKEFESSASPSLNNQGYGLGLFISNSLAKLLGNKPIKVKSKLEKGSIFTFAVDIFKENIIAREYESFDISSIDENFIRIDMSPYNSQYTSLFSNVLIVDDNEWNRLALGGVLLEYNISYDEAVSGRSAIKKVIESDQKDKAYKVIFMDCNLPEIDGCEATKIINRLFKDRTIKELPKIIGNTGFTSEKDLAACFESGMVECLIKPSTPEKIISTIRRFM